MENDRIDLTKLDSDTKLLVETTGGVWEFEYIQNDLIRVSGTDERFKRQGFVGKYLEAIEPGVRVGRLPNRVDSHIVRGYVCKIEFRDLILVTKPVVSVLIIGDGWEYEAIPPEEEEIDA